MPTLINTKIKDSTLEVSGSSRADQYWKSAGFRELYKKFRSPELSAPPDEPYKYLNSCGVRAVEFGNWVPIDMRYNYMVGAIVAINDINRVTGLNKFGFDNLALAFGSSGHSKALAHYEPTTDTINLTRYSRGSGKSGFIVSGGVGALAHEYGHFLDYYFGRLVPVCKSDSQALSGGRSTATTFTQESLNDSGLWGAMSRLLSRIVWEKNGVKTEYYNRASKIGGGDYWIRRNELFARCFEQWVNYQLSKKNILNRLLTQRKYETRAYWTDAEFKPIVPLMDEVVRGMATFARTGKYSKKVSQRSASGSTGVKGMIVFNVKPSNRLREKFVKAYPEASFIGSARLGSKSKSYQLPAQIYEANYQDLKKYGSKARERKP